ncbi:MAG: FAD-dependent oxidoreductase [Bacteroidota bacterium]
MAKTYDILIVGAGTSGMACAITAAERGLRVGVIEKSDIIGGALHWSGGHMSAGGTRLQKRKGIEDSEEKHLEDIYRINGKSGNLALTEIAVKEAPKTIDWLEDIGFEFAPECPRIIYGHIAYETARTHYGTEKAMSIYKVLEPLWKKYEASGHIECHLNTKMSGLGRTGNRFDYVLCQNEWGTQEIHGKHIVLTTGGYGSNPEFFGKKHPGIPLVSSCYPTATADAHQILEENGGVFHMGQYHLPSLGGIEKEVGDGLCNFNEAWAMVMTSVYRQPREIYVNANGHRFMAEDEPDAEAREHAVMQQPDWYFWAVFDETARVRKDDNGNHNPVIIGWSNEAIVEEADRGQSLVKADTLEGLSKKINVPKKTLTETVASYNTMVDKGEDPSFHRSYLKDSISTGPFYALKIHASVLVTFGGMKVNDKLQLVDQNGNVMEGLYAAGEIIGLGATSGSSFCSGMAITPALGFGRILGRSLS